MKNRLILASSSPRRREILEKMGLEFEVILPDYEEIFENSDFTYGKIEDAAYNKAKSVFYKLEMHSPFTNHHSLILGVDTVVVLDNKILGKPKNENEAVLMLKMLSGKKHSVVTSICAIYVSNFAKKIISTKSFVEFKVLGKDLIKNYVEIYRPLDKAGSYGIQELPEGFINYIEGSFENIMGLCPIAVSKILNEFKPI